LLFEKSNFAYFMAFIIIGAVLGSAAGALLVNYFPGLAFIQKSLTGPIGLNLEIISFNIKLNLSSIIGLILGILIFRKV
jgi:hypothetical protein